MKIYITSFIHDGKEYEGPNIHADSFDAASIIAKEQNLTVCGELTEILQDNINEELNDKTLH
jgi:hypothetical protein